LVCHNDGRQAEGVFESRVLMKIFGLKEGEGNKGLEEIV
jgi:hypothetical protein